MIIEQIVEIPSDHRVFFEFLAPKEIPPGPARVEVKFIPVLDKQDKSASETGKDLAFLEGTATPRADRLLGAAAHMGDISLEEIRTERLTKYLL